MGLQVRELAQRVADTRLGLAVIPGRRKRLLTEKERAQNVLFAAARIDHRQPDDLVVMQHASDTLARLPRHL